MNPRPRLLDLFCGAGGAAMGYHRAGFDVVGVDLSPQPHFPFEFVQGDALAYAAAHGAEFDAIAGSPPCQAYSEATPLHHRVRLPRLIEPLQALLDDLGRAFIIENVENARALLRQPVKLCGTSFGLGVWRHRYFECNGFTTELAPPCAHVGHPVTIYPGSNTRRVYGNTTIAQQRVAMGIDWMTGAEIREAIPPAYTEWIGRQLIGSLG